MDFFKKNIYIILIVITIAFLTITIAYTIPRISFYDSDFLLPLIVYIYFAYGFLLVSIVTFMIKNIVYDIDEFKDTLKGMIKFIVMFIVFDFIRGTDIDYVVSRLVSQDGYGFFLYFEILIFIVFNYSIFSFFRKLRLELKSH